MKPEDVDMKGHASRVANDLFDAMGVSHGEQLDIIEVSILLMALAYVSANLVAVCPRANEDEHFIAHFKQQCETTRRMIAKMAQAS